MSLRVVTWQRKSLRNIRAFTTTLDPAALLIIGTVSVLVLAGMAVTGLAEHPVLLLAPVAVLLAPVATAGHGWYRTAREHRPPRYTVARTQDTGAAAPRNWLPRYGPVGHALSREQAIMDTRRPEANGRIHHCVQLGRGQQNRTVGDRLGQGSS